MNIPDVYKLSREITQDVYQLLNDSRHNIKQYLGEVIVYDSCHVAWKVKICCTGTRGRYLKISQPNGQELRAFANGYESYLQITTDEWEVFYRLANGVECVRDHAQNILNRLVG